MLSDLHAAHQGIASTTRRARETIYWPHLNQELKDHITGCLTCDQYHDKQPKEPLIPHDRSPEVGHGDWEHGGKCMSRVVIHCNEM